VRDLICRRYTSGSTVTGSMEPPDELRDKLLNDRLDDRPVYSTGVKRCAIAAVLIGLYCDFALLTVVIPTVPARLQAEGIDDSLIFVLFSSKAAVQILANPVVGRLVDNFGPMRPLLLAITVLAASSLSFGISLSSSSIHHHMLYAILFSSRAIQGVASCALMSGGMALLTRLHEADDRSSAMSTAMLGVALGVMTGAPLGGILADRISVLAPYGGIAAMVVLPLILHLKFVLEGGFGEGSWPEEEEDEARLDEMPQGGTATSLYGDRFVIIPTGAVAVINMCIAVIEPSVPLYLAKEPFNYGSMAQGLIFGISTLGYLCGTPIAGYLADGTFPKWKIMIVGVFALSAGLIVMAIDRQLWLLCFGLALVGIGMGLGDTPSLPLLAEVVEWRGRNEFGCAYALMDMATSMGFLCGPLLAAVLQLCSLKLETVTITLGIACVLYVPVLASMRSFDVIRQGDEAYAHVESGFTPTGQEEERDSYMIKHLAGGPD